MNSPSDLVSALQAVVEPARISVRSEDLDTYARDLWPRQLLAVGGRQPPPVRPQTVVWPKSAAEVQAILRLCSAQGVPVVPYGAGSGVAGGAVGPAGSLVLDTKQLRDVRIDAERGVVTFQPGILGWHLEERLNRQGLSLGHFPSSIMCSTAGGWVATRGAGQMSTKYGKIEDMVHSLELCTGDGARLTLDNGDRGGSDWVQLVTGSEGTLGVITSATCAVRKMPQSRRLRGFSFPSIEAAVNGIKRLLQLGLRPAVVRLYDEIDTLLSGMGRHSQPKKGETSLLAGLGIAGIDFDELLKLLRTDAQRLAGRVERWLLQRLLGETEPLTRVIGRLLERFSNGSLMILGFEGETDIVTAEDIYAREELGRLGGRDLGEGPGQHWLRHRYDVSFKMSRAFRAGAFTDTIEVATTWDRLLPLYHEVRAAVAPYALCMAHFSHAYVDGCSIYFTLIGRRRASFELPDGENRRAVAEDQALYDKLWRAAMLATLRSEATISHHHGIGRLKAPFMLGEHGASLRILSALRRACDPQHICNPGNLAPDVTAAAKPAPAATPSSAAPLRISASDCLVEVDATARLYEIERALHEKGLSLGGLSPRAWGRTLGEALAQPHPAEASLLAGRLRDRRSRLRAVLRDGEELVVPPHVAPRRATGPDLGQAFLGQREALGEVRQATLRLHPRTAEPLWAGYLFADAAPAVRALFVARALHGAVAMSEILLCDGALLAKVLGAAVATELSPAPEGFALLVQPCGPEAVARATLKAFEAQIKATPFSRISATLCCDFWTPAGLWAAAATAESIAAISAPFPQCELSLSLADCTPEKVAARLTQAGTERLLCGVYLHGMTLCTTAPIDEAEPPVPDAEAAQTRLWPRVVAAMERG